MPEEHEEEFERLGFVDKYYEMDPTKEDLIKGHQLEEGLRVLIADPRFRSNLKRDPFEYYSNEGFRENALRWNRWMTVTYLDTETMDSGLVSFVGLYDDGTKKDFILSTLHGWFVKIQGVSNEMLEKTLDWLRESDSEDLAPEQITNIPKDVENFTLGIQKHDYGNSAST